MKKILFLWLLALPCFAQSAVQLYYVGGSVVLADSLGGNQSQYWPGQLSVKVAGSNLEIRTTNNLIRVRPGQLLNAAGLPYSTATAKAAFDAFMQSSGAATYTQGQVTTLLQGYYQRVSVASKAAAIAQATGPQPKIITVAVDESDSNRPGNKYLYDGDGQPLGQPLF